MTFLSTDINFLWTELMADESEASGLRQLIHHAGGNLCTAAPDFKQGDLEGDWLLFAKGSKAVEKRNCKRLLGLGVTFHLRSLLSDHALLHQFLDRSQAIAFVI